MTCSVDQTRVRMTPLSLSGVTRADLSKVWLSSLHLEIKLFLDILEKSKFKVMDVFDSVVLDYWSEGREYNSISFNLTDLKNNSRILPTRSIYPSDKMTFTLPDLNRDKTIVFLNIYLDMYEQFDVGLVLEDSKRKELSGCQKSNLYSLYIFYIHFGHRFVSGLRV